MMHIIAAVIVIILMIVCPARADIELGAYLGTLTEVTSTTTATDYLAILRGTTLYKIKPGNITGSGITATLGADISIIMGDTGGSNKVKFLDSDSTEVGSINSDGTPTFGSSTGVVYSTAGAYAPTTTLSNIAVAVDTALRVVCSDASKNIKACDASTGTGAPVLATDPTVALGENSTINSGATPTVNAAGEVAVDTTSDQFRYYGGAERVIPYKKTISIVVPSVADTDDMWLMKAPYGMTIIALDCIVSAATSATINIQECGSDGTSCSDTATSDLACDTDGANTTTFNNAVIDSGDWIRLDVASISGTPGILTVTATYSVVAD